MTFSQHLYSSEAFLSPALTLLVILTPEESVHFTYHDVVSACFATALGRTSHTRPPSSIAL